MTQILSHQTIGKILAVLLLLTGFLALFQAPIVDSINKATRVDASQHVSNLPCGAGTSVRQCPGELVCSQGPGGRFTAERAGANVSGARCVTPAYTERYCGILEPPQAFNPGTNAILPCGPDQPLTALPSILLDTDLPGRFLATEGSGTALIHQHNLTLLQNDPDASDIPVKTLIDCQKAAASIETVSYNWTAGQLTATITNTGTEPLPVIILATTHNDTTTLHRRDGPAPNQTQTYTINATAPLELHLSLPTCGNLPLATTNLTTDN
ncbi:MAG: hypothetical protein SV186_05070 [Candidatus Nanohaloarchaea archaeon]|nr:hypothetical protein [Candidatus Nanohaloarchaea archaeon]